MGKRRLENDIEELSDDILGDLEPDERFQILLKARSKGKEQWIDRLIETCPRCHYSSTDRKFTDRGRLAQLLAHQAVYELHTTYLQYELVRQKRHTARLIDYERDEEPSDEELKRASERADDLRELFVKLYISYHSHRQFATEVLGVDPEMWLTLHSEGSAVFEIVSDALDDQMEIELAESHLNELVAGDDETVEPNQIEQDDDLWVTLDDVAEIRYEGLAAIWEDTIAEIP